MASGAVATKINLGEDGQLPNLVVADTKEAAKSEDEEKATSPALMIVVLVFSVVVSVVMLVAPEQGAQKEETSSKQKSIEHIQEHYIGTGREIKRHQMLLREGIQAERRGDQQSARSAFREVLRMLRAETRGEMGLTAPKWADKDSVPNDRDLEYHLNVLLADD